MTRYVATWKDPLTGKRKAKNCPNRELRDRLQAEMRRRTWMVESGLVTARELLVADAARKPVDSVIAEFTKHLRRRRATKQSVAESKRAATVIFKKAGIKCIGEVNVKPVNAALDKMAEGGASPRTINLYLHAAKAVCKWAVKNSYLHENPLDSLQQVEDLSLVKVRRSLTVAEFELLRGSKRWPDYLLLVRTLLRWSEAASLTFQHVDLEKGLLTVPKGIGKRDRKLVAEVPLARDVLVLLRRRRAVGNVPLLLHRKPVPHVWRAEVKRLGIEHKTEAGYAQCSSLRPTGCTWLAQAGVDLDTIMRLRRDMGPLAESVYIDRSRLRTQLRAGVDRVQHWYEREQRKLRKQAIST